MRQLTLDHAGVRVSELLLRHLSTARLDAHAAITELRASMEAEWSSTHLDALSGEVLALLAACCEPVELTPTHIATCLAARVPAVAM